MSILHKIVADNIAEKRKEIGLSQEQLSLNSGLNKAYVGHIERLYKKPSLETLEKISKALNIKLIDLLGDC
ncbi:MAG: helix-turn-helix domain-containing protein [Alphaproteobacteria bacterium]